jgi:hypothetical protein
MSLRELMKETRYVMRAHDQNLDAGFEEKDRSHTCIFKIGVLSAKETVSDVSRLRTRGRAAHPIWMSLEGTLSECLLDVGLRCV